MICKVSTSERGNVNRKKKRFQGQISREEIKLAKETEKWPVKSGTQNIMKIFKRECFRKCIIKKLNTPLAFSHFFINTWEFILKGK